MAYNNIYDWHDSVRKYLEKEIEKDRRETISGWMDRYQKWGQDHREELKTIWGVPKNPANGGAWERQSKIEPDLRNIWGTPGQTYTSCGQPKKRDPNDITDLCKVRVE